MVVGILLQILARHGLDDALQGYEVETAVGHVRAWGEVALAVGYIVDQSVAVRRTIFLLQHVGVGIGGQT